MAKLSDINYSTPVPKATRLSADTSGIEAVGRAATQASSAIFDRAAKMRAEQSKVSHAAASLDFTKVLNNFKLNHKTIDDEGNPTFDQAPEQWLEAAEQAIAAGGAKIQDEGERNRWIQSQQKALEAEKFSFYKQVNGGRNDYNLSVANEQIKAGEESRNIETIYTGIQLKEDAGLITAEQAEFQRQQRVPEAAEWQVEDTLLELEANGNPADYKKLDDAVLSNKLLTTKQRDRLRKDIAEAQVDTALNRANEGVASAGLQSDAAAIKVYEKIQKQLLDADADSFAGDIDSKLSISTKLDSMIAPYKKREKARLGLLKAREESNPLVNNRRIVTAAQKKVLNAEFNERHGLNVEGGPDDKELLANDVIINDAISQSKQTPNYFSDEMSRMLHSFAVSPDTTQEEARRVAQVYNSLPLGTRQLTSGNLKAVGEFVAAYQANNGDVVRTQEFRTADLDPANSQRQSDLKALYSSAKQVTSGLLMVAERLGDDYEDRVNSLTADQVGQLIRDMKNTAVSKANIPLGVSYQNSLVQAVQSLGTNAVTGQTEVGQSFGQNYSTLERLRYGTMTPKETVSLRVENVQERVNVVRKQMGEPELKLDVDTVLMYPTPTGSHQIFAEVNGQMQFISHIESDYTATTEYQEDTRTLAKQDIEAKRAKQKEFKAQQERERAIEKLKRDQGKKLGSRGSR